MNTITQVRDNFRKLEAQVGELFSTANYIAYLLKGSSPPETKLVERPLQPGMLNILIEWQVRLSERIERVSKVLKHIESEITIARETTGSTDVKLSDEDLRELSDASVELSHA